MESTATSACLPLVLAGECIYIIVVVVVAAGVAATVLHWHHNLVSLAFRCGLKTSVSSRVLQVSRIMD